MKITFAPQEETSQLKKYIKKVMEALGFTKVIVTDESTVRDFLEWGDRDYTIKNRQTGETIFVTGDPAIRIRNDEVLRQAEDKLHFPVKDEDLIIELARKLMQLMEG